MDINNSIKSVGNKYVEAETVSEDSDISSLSNFTDRTSEINHFVEGISKVKNLIQELEDSFRESNNISNNLLLQSVLLRAESQNIGHKIYQKRSFATEKYDKNCCESCMVNLNKNKSLCKTSPRNKLKQLITTEIALKNSRKSFLFNSEEEIDILHNTIEDLQKKLREREANIEILCQKYMRLKTNKKKMETDLKSQITSLREQLHVTCDTLTEFQNETESNIESALSSTVDSYEALFLQEKLRCRKLMYEKVRLHHEIQNLEDKIRRLNTMTKEKEAKYCRSAQSSLSKISSEQLTRHSLINN